jgi:uncharacterized membrane protein YkvI
MSAASGPTRFQRFLLPGLAFKAVVIGGGYATGRELAEFFLPSGPLGGLQGMILAMLIWSAVCALTYSFARLTASYDYRSFFQALLGRFWILFEIAWLMLLVLILAVVAAAAGAIGAALFAWPEWVGTLILSGLIIGITAYGTEAAERLFRYSSTLIYLTYALFLILALTSFGERIPVQLAQPVPSEGWIVAGITYASYNVVAAVAILPFLRHLTSRRDAIIAGVLSGPLAILPAILFFLCMAAFHPEIGAEALPSDFLLREIGLPWFQLLFQLMIFCALLETGIGIVNAFHERIARRRADTSLTLQVRFLIGAVLVLGSAFAASGVGLVGLIASGYGAFGWIMLGLFVAPLATIGLWRLHRTPDPSPAQSSGAMP